MPFYKGKVLYLIYTNDSILAALTTQEIDNSRESIRSTGIQFTEKGDLNNFLGVKNKKHHNGTI